jgi:DnaK suppressor protein
MRQRSMITAEKFSSTPEAGMVDTELYRQRLVQLEHQIAAKLQRELTLGRDQVRDVSRDAGDDSVSDEAASEDFTGGELDATTLQQVEDALKRIDAGTFGQCAVDGGPIELKRLDAIPWTPYCLTHERLLEARAQRRTPTL